MQFIVILFDLYKKNGLLKVRSKSSLGKVTKKWNVNRWEILYKAVRDTALKILNWGSY